MYHILREDRFRARYDEDFTALSPFDAGIPLVELSDPVLQQIYYYRWNTYCSHIRSTPAGFVVTEFTEDVPWAGIYNTIVCAAGHHLYEGRWLRERKYINDYARFWFQPEANLRLYSFWAANSVYAVCSAWGDFSLAKALYEDLKANFSTWKAGHLLRRRHWLSRSQHHRSLGQGRQPLQLCPRSVPFLRWQRACPQHDPYQTIDRAFTKKQAPHKRCL